jgi:hypothetical protein
MLVGNAARLADLDAADFATCSTVYACTVGITSFRFFGLAIVWRLLVSRLLWVIVYVFV